LGKKEEIQKRFGRLKKSSYLCQAKIKWSVRLTDVLLAPEAP